MDYFTHKFRSKSPIEIVGIIIFGAVAITGFAALFGFVTMWLWNALVPEIFGLSALTYWQAVGLLILFKILFGGFGSGHKSSSSKKHQGEGMGKKKEFSKWALYEQFWKEEGESAYQEFIKRANGDAVVEEIEVEIEDTDGATVK